MAQPTAKKQAFATTKKMPPAAADDVATLLQLNPLKIAKEARKDPSLLQHVKSFLSTLQDALQEERPPPQKGRLPQSPTCAGGSLKNVEDLSDDLLGKVVSYFANEDNQKTFRLVSRRFRTVVQSTPPEVMSLDINFRDGPRTNKETAWNVEWDEKGWQLNVFPRFPWHSEAMLLPLIPSLESLPPLSRIILHFHRGHQSWYTLGNSLSRLSQCQLANTSLELTELTLSELTGEILRQIRFDAIQLSLPKVRKLSITSPCATLAEILPPITSSSSLKGIKDFSIEFTDALAPGFGTPELEDPEAVFRPLSLLKRFPKLETLCLWGGRDDEDDDEGGSVNQSGYMMYEVPIMLGFLKGLTEVHTLKSLHVDPDFELRNNIEETGLCFGQMLSSMPRLEHLSQLGFFYPESGPPSIWDGVRKAGLKTHPLKKLELDLDEPAVEQLRDNARACKEIFTSLTDLVIHLVNPPRQLLHQGPQQFADLKGHPSLQTLVLYINSCWSLEQEKTFAQRCKQEIGGSVAVKARFRGSVNEKLVFEGMA